MGTFPPPLKPYLRPEYYPSYPDWDKGKCLIVGGGPSLRDMKWGDIRAWNQKPHHYTIAVNDACMDIVPEADIAYWVDARWFQWNQERLSVACRAKRRFTGAHGMSVDQGGGTYVENSHASDFFTTPKYVAGMDSGCIAINLAFHCNASSVYLLGFDMHDTPAKTQGTGNYHEAHLLKQEGTPRTTHFVPKHRAMKIRMAEMGVDETFMVYNCTPNSALKCWPYIHWEEIK